MIRTLTPNHVKYIVIRHKVDNASLHKIMEELQDPEIAVRNDFKPHKVAENYFYKKFPIWWDKNGEEISGIIKEYFQDYMTVPLATKRVRIEERAKLYEQTTNPELKRKILNDLQSETGEQDWMKAIEGSGNKTTNILNIDSDILLQIASSVKDNIETSKLQQAVPTESEEIQN